MWLCRCDCGKQSNVQALNLRSGGSKSCGCSRDDNRHLPAAKHNMCKTKEYAAWRAALNRCNNPNVESYPRYGGRGIAVCNRWDSFENFFEDMGKAPSKDHSLGRIDNEGNYEPTNCEWQTIVEQGSNKSNNINLSLNGKTQTASAWCRELGIKSSCMFARIASGWSDEKILTTPVKFYDIQKNSIRT